MTGCFHSNSNMERVNSYFFILDDDSSDDDSEHGRTLQGTAKCRNRG